MLVLASTPAPTLSAPTTTPLTTAPTSSPPTTTPHTTPAVIISTTQLPAAGIGFITPVHINLKVMIQRVNAWQGIMIWASM